MSKKKTQEEFEQELFEINPNIQVLGQYVNYRTKIRCKCKIDGYEWNTTPSILLSRKGCPACSGHTVVKGINDLWTVIPQIASLLSNPDNGYKYTKFSGYRADWKCPECGYIIKDKVISSITREGLSCPKCSDGISYPEKFMYNLLKQLNIDFEYQYSPNWIKPKRYDFYIPSKQIIIEMDGGLGHGHCNTKTLTIEKSLEIDNIKDQLARQHKIESIRINCLYKNTGDRFINIKQNIISGKLSELFDLSKIDWITIDKQSEKSVVYEICKYKKEHSDKSTSYISKLYRLSQTTIINYLNIGNKYKWCDYNSIVERHKHPCTVKVICLNNLQVFNSIKLAANWCGLKDTSNIIQNIKNQKASAGKHPITGEKLNWMYYDEYLNKQNEKLTNRI